VQTGVSPGPSENSLELSEMLVASKLEVVVKARCPFKRYSENNAEDQQDLIMKKNFGGGQSFH